MNTCEYALVVALTGAMAFANMIRIGR